MRTKEEIAVYKAAWAKRNRAKLNAQNRERYAADPPALPTLDRIDNSKGYVKGNVIVVSWRANRLKSDATVAEMRRLVDFYGALG